MPAARRRSSSSPGLGRRGRSSVGSSAQPEPAGARGRAAPPQATPVLDQSFARAGGPLAPVVAQERATKRQRRRLLRRPFRSIDWPAGWPHLVFCHPARGSVPGSYRAAPLSIAPSDNPVAPDPGRPRTRRWRQSGAGHVEALGQLIGGHRAQLVHREDGVTREILLDKAQAAEFAASPCRCRDHQRCGRVLEDIAARRSVRARCRSHSATEITPRLLRSAIPEARGRATATLAGRPERARIGRWQHARSSRIGVAPPPP